MRIAFVGKGGSGKTTLTAAFSSFLEKNNVLPTMIFDADINVNLPLILGFSEINFEKYLSNPKVVEILKRWFLGKNIIADLGAFRKTTPPTRKSNIIKIRYLENTPLAQFGFKRNNLYFFAVGTYQDYEIGASCYHNHLAIFEIILNHLDDRGGVVVSDMVAGVDAFAGTLHSQFDIICFVTEPTKKSLEVLNHYENLAKNAGVWENFFVVGNKIRDEEDKSFLKKFISSDKLLGFFIYDDYFHFLEREGGFMDFDKLNPLNKELIKVVFDKLKNFPDKRNERIKKIYELHKKYTNQEFIRLRYGDLSYQIDFDFKFEEDV